MSAVGDWLHGRGLRKAWESGKGVYPSPRCPRLTERLGPRSAVYGGIGGAVQDAQMPARFQQDSSKDRTLQPRENSVHEHR
jgi:hypothetical protein